MGADEAPAPLHPPTDLAPLTARGRLVIADGARTVAILSVDIRDLAGFIRRGLLRSG